MGSRQSALGEGMGWARNGCLGLLALLVATLLVAAGGLALQHRYPHARVVSNAVRDAGAAVVAAARSGTAAAAAQMGGVGSGGSGGSGGKDENRIRDGGSTFLAHMVKTGPYGDEQFNGQRFNIMELLFMARKLDRVLVEPVLVVQPRNSSAYEEDYRKGFNNKRHFLGEVLYPLSRYMNISRMEAYLGRRMVSMEQFHALATADDGAGLTLVSANRGTWSAPCHGAVGDQATKPAARFWSIEWPVSRLVCMPPTKNPMGEDSGERKTIFSAAEWQTRLDGGPAAFVGLDFMRGYVSLKGSPNWYRDGALGPEYWAIREHMEYTDEMVALADAFMARSFPPAKYLAVHWRRGDRGNNEMGRNAMDQFKRLGAAALVPRIQRLLEEHRLAHVYISTNSGDAAELAYLEKELGSALLPRLPRPAQWENELEGVIVEEIVCARAAAFLASGPSFDWLSSFSRVVAEQRRLARGGDPNVADPTTFFFG